MIRRRPIGVDLLRVAARSRAVLDRRATSQVAAFIASAVTDDGGFRGRGPAADLYYTLFGVLAGGVSGARLDRRPIVAYLDVQSLAALDLPHLAALVQCQRLLHLLGVPRPLRAEAPRALAAFRTPEGGFATECGAPCGTAYGLYLALIAFEALGAALPEPERAREAAVALLRAELARPLCALGPLTSAVLALQALCAEVPAAAVLQALLACRTANGGYRAHPRAGGPDLLSTAIAAFALRRLAAPVSGPAAAETASFVQSLWDASGGFRGAADDPVPDVEYTFYALLVLGALEP